MTDTDNTQAESLAQQADALRYDGTRDGAKVLALCRDHGATISHGIARFDDGSCIVVEGAAWDVACPSCLTWEGAGCHADDCEG